MAHVSTHIDRPITLGRGQVGSSNLATGAVYHPKIGPGTGQHGSLDLRRAVGTITTVDVGSFITSYGSAGTFATRIVRAAYGSYKGTVQAPKLFGRYGSFTGTLQAPNTRGAYGSHTTSAGSRSRYAEGSYRRIRVTGTIFANQGSFTRLVGSLGAARGVAHGTLQDPRLPANLLTKGTIQARYGTIGTLATPLTRSRYGSYTGTVRAPNIRGAYGSHTRLAGSTFAGGLGSFRRANIQGTITAHLGSFTRLAGTMSAARIIGGTIGRPQYPQPDMARIKTGTINIGSLKPFSGAPRGIAFSPRGDLWHSKDTAPRYIIRLGTKTLTGGTGNRIGTTLIGSIPFPPSTVKGIAFSPRGDLWVISTGSTRVYRIGTLGLRAGTNSRIGSQRIGSFVTRSNSPDDIAFDRRGNLFLTESAVGERYVFLYGTLGLRAGTNSRIGTTPIGSFRKPTSNSGGIAQGPNGKIFHGDTANIYKSGTLPLRAGTNSRLGTYSLGSWRATGFTPSGFEFSARGDLWWSSVTGTGNIIRTGTPDGAKRRIDYLIPAPRGVNKFVQATALLTSTSGTSSRLTLAQRGLGTIATVDVPLLAVSGQDRRKTISGWIERNQGSYSFKTTGGTPPQIISWFEWSPQ